MKNKTLTNKPVKLNIIIAKSLEVQFISKNLQNNQFDTFNAESVICLKMSANKSNYDCSSLIGVCFILKNNLDKI